jgi:microcystin-dependent protein
MTRGSTPKLILAVVFVVAGGLGASDAVAQEVPTSGNLPIGTVLPFVGAEPPQGFVLADGRELDAKSYQALCGILGERFVKPGDRVGTCRLPNLKDAFVMGAGSVADVGKTGGVNQGVGTNADPVYLKTGGTDHPFALRAQEQNGVVNHQTLCAGCNLVNSFIAPQQIKVQFDNRPHFVALSYIVKAQ